MIKKFLMLVVLGTIFLSEIAQAYDLPKIKIPKKTNVAAENQSIFKSDWDSAEQFFQKIETILNENQTLKASSTERIFSDKNLIFVAFYKGNAYFLDKYSIKISKDDKNNRVWRQRIYPIGKNISAQNSKATKQNFCFSDNKFYNSSSHNNEISKIPNEEDRKFLAECFNVGYYYAFNEELDTDQCCKNFF